MSKYTCFVISPIGEKGTERYEEFQDLYNLIIVPALEVFDISVSRGDHHVLDAKIDSSVIENVQNADFCICDISEPNPNVYYELGRRDETGKYTMLLKKKGTPISPVDINNRRYFEYSWEGRRSIREAQTEIRNWVKPLIDQGLEHRGGSATLRDIADSISRLERKIDRMQVGGVSNATPAVAAAGAVAAGTPQMPGKSDPVDALKFALISRNVPLAETAMDQLKFRMDPIKYYDQVVEQVAAMGSLRAGQMLTEFAREFFDSNVSFKKKTEYLGCLVSYANRQDKEAEVVDLVEELCAQLERETEGEDPQYIIQIYNQINRLRYGMYNNTENTSDLNKAIEALEKGLGKLETNFLYYNLSICYFAYYKETQEQDYLLKAKEAIDNCIRIARKDNEHDKDHLKLAYRIYRILDDPNRDQFLQEIGDMDPIAAALLEESENE